MKNSNVDGVHNEYYKMYNCCDASSVLWFIFGMSESGKQLGKLKPLLHKALSHPQAQTQTQRQTVRVENGYES